MSETRTTVPTERRPSVASPAFVVASMIVLGASCGSLARFLPFGGHEWVDALGVVLGAGIPCIAAVLGMALGTGIVAQEFYDERHRRPRSGGQ